MFSFKYQHVCFEGAVVQGRHDEVVKKNTCPKQLCGHMQ